MPEVKAFVAHSFADNDKTLVGIFTGHFDSLSGTLLGFSWEHAAQAQPESIAEKVLKLIEDKNVFIGICTRSERTVPLNAGTRIPMFRIVGFNESDVQWKTSDWIIQEIGLAVGREMKVIIFLEEGVRKPGGLFGDIEYIPFTRKNPQASFDKLIQMLGTINPKEKATAAISSTAATTADQTKAPIEEEDLQPKTSWNEREYELAVFRSLANRDEDTFTRIDAAYRESPFCTDVAKWEARVEWVRMIVGKKFNLEKIRGAAKDNPTDRLLQIYLGNGYREYGEHEAAARAFERATENSQTALEKIDSQMLAAREYAALGREEKSITIVEALKQTINEQPELEFRLLSRCSDLAETEKNSLLQVLLLERMVELRPDDIEIRFKLAYQHSEVGNSEMALYHYVNIPEVERSAIAWNNLGVAYGRFRWPIKAIHAYRQAERQNETLAMCNIGFSFLQAGFLAEAREIATRAASNEPHHKNVPVLQTNLNEASEAESTALTEVLGELMPKAAFYRSIGEKVLKATPASLAQRWSSSEGKLELRMTGSSVRLFGAQERPSLYGLLGASLATTSQTMTVHHIEYTGRLHGGVIVGSVRRWRDTEVPSALESGPPQVIMVLNDGESEIQVMENPTSRSSRIYAISRS